MRLPPRLRWTHAELVAEQRKAGGYVVWKVGCLVMSLALAKHASIVFVKKISPTKLVVQCAIDGVLVDQMTPPAKLCNSLVSQMMTLGGPIDVEPGARAEIELVREDGTLLVCHALTSSNEWGLTLTMRLTSPPRMLN